MIYFVWVKGVLDLRLRLEKMIIWFTRGMNLRSKILILYGLILLAPTLILGSGAIYMVIRSFHHSYLVTVDEAVRQTARNVDFGKQSYDFWLSGQPPTEN